MYGLYFLVTRDIILKKYSQAMWEKILIESKLGKNITITSMYDDAQLANLINVTCKYLNMTSAQLVEKIGFWFIAVFVKQSTVYSKLLDVMGSNLIEILNNVNDMHAHLLKVAHFPNIASPTFQVRNVKANSLHLHYTSGRPSRGAMYCPLVVGIVKGIGHNHNMKGLQVQQIKFLAKGDEVDVFRVSWEGSMKVSDDEDTSDQTHHIPQIGLDGPNLCRLLPFHIIFNSKGQILQAGESVQIVISMALDDLISSHFSIAYPEGMNFDDLKLLRKRSTNDIFILSHKFDATNNFLLEGELLWDSSNKLFIFACTPLLKSFAEAQHFGLTLSDFALFDKASKVTMLVSNAREQDVVNLQTLDREKLRLQKESESRQKGVFRGLRLKKKRKSLDNETNEADKGRFDNIDFNISCPFSNPAALTNSAPKEISPRKSKKKESGSKKSDTMDGGKCPVTGSYAKSADKGSKSPDQNLTSATITKKGLRAGGREFDRVYSAYQEMLLSDSWAGFPLILKLLNLNVSSDNDTIFTQTTIFYSCVDKIESLLKTAFSEELKVASQCESLTNHLFRETSVATKLWGKFLEQFGASYLSYIIDPLIQEVTAFKEPLEVDERKRPRDAKQTIDFNIKSLIEVSERFLKHISQSVKKCPIMIKRILVEITQEVKMKHPHLHIPVLMNLIFLRFITPALVVPHHSRTESTSRTLTLVSKLISALLNNVKFEKEQCMIPLNTFINTQNISISHNFITSLITISEEDIEKNKVDLKRQCGEAILAAERIKEAIIINMDQIWSHALENPHLYKSFKNFCSIALCSATFH